MKKNLLTLILLLFLSVLGFSQSLINLKSRDLIIDSDTIFLDTLSVQPSSIIFYDENGKTLNNIKYHFDFKNSLIIFDERPENQRLKIQYRSFPYNFSSPISLLKKSDLLKSDSDQKTLPFDYIHTVNSEKIIPQGSLSRKGSISRGISFGNNQDVIVNSSLNLQLDGKLNDDLFIKAVISDSNIPIQPDGNTQQLQEFDKVFINLYNDRISLIAGDFELKKPEGYFLNYNKKAQGANIKLTTKRKTKQNNEFNFENNVSAAVSKGNFHRQRITSIEGNQGPYKLSGANNETFIVILAGSEKVYIDGKLQKRGLDNDYAIDYNLGEVTFTANQPINKDKRIVVEYEYSDRNYSRTLITTSNTFTNKQTKVWLNLYDESDNKNKPFDQDLSNSQKKLMNEIGDSIDLAIIPAFESIGFNTTEIRYRLIDTVVNGISFDSVFIHSINPDDAIFRLSFAFVGQGKGNYKRSISSANGRVFEWIAPINGIPQGDYMPYRKLITPKKSQMLNLGTQTSIKDNTHLYIDLAYSKNDINTFSKKDSKDNIGYALKTNIKHYFLKNKKNSLFIASDYVFADKNFKEIESYKTIEFNRDWNINNKIKPSNESVLTNSLTYNNTKLGLAKYQHSWLQKEKEYNGSEHLLTTNLKLDSWKINSNARLMDSKTQLHKTNFLRHDIDLSKDFKSLSIGIGEEANRNIWRDRALDTLITNSNIFNSLFGYLKSNDSTKLLSYKAKYEYRQDENVKGNRFQKSTTSKNISLSGGLESNPKHKIRTVFNYRKLEVNDTTLYEGESENNMTGKIEYNFRLWKGVISSTNYYELGSNLEKKIEYSYIEVAPGQGVYTWTDYNSNGIQEIDEFEIANFVDQANFIRVISPSTELIKTFCSNINQSININPEIKWRNKKGFKKLVSRFSNQFAYSITQKSSSSQFSEFANPFNRNIDDLKLINYSASIRNNLALNRGNPKFGANYIIQSNNNKTLLISGFDIRRLYVNTIQLRYNISTKLGILSNSSFGTKSYESAFFTNKNYKINKKHQDLEINFQPNLNNRISLKYNFQTKDNKLGTQRLTTNDLGLEYRLSSLQKGSLNTNFNCIYYKYNSPTNDAIAYEMLEGLFPGLNFTWAVSFQRQLANGLNINLTYSGRKSFETKVIHTGGIQLRAYF